MTRHLVIPSSHDDNWEYIFRKQQSRPVEMLKRHKVLGQLGSWQVARNFCLKGVISYDVLAEHFGMSEWQFHYQ